MFDEGKIVDTSTGDVSASVVVAGGGKNVLPWMRPMSSLAAASSVFRRVMVLMR